MKKAYRLRMPAVFVLLSVLILYAGNAPAGFYVIPVKTGSKNTVIVSHKGADTESGAALLDALTKITDASAGNPYLIVIEPGTYNIGSNSLQMKSHVDITGYGEDVTTITGNTDSSSAGVVNGADDSELRFLTVENTGGGNDARAVFNDGVSPAITRVKVKASSGTYNYGICNEDSDCTITDSIVEVTGGTENFGVYNHNGSPEMTNVTVTAKNGDYNTGVFNWVADTEMTNVSSDVSGGNTNRAVAVNTCSSLTMKGVSATASSGSNDNYGVHITSSSPEVTHLTVKTSGGAANIGFFQNGGTVEIKNSDITATMNTVYAQSGSVTVIRTHLDGLGVGAAGGATVTCKCVCDGSDTCYADKCP